MPRITHPGLSGDKAKLKLSSQLLLGSIGPDDGSLLNFNSSNMLTQVLLDPRDLPPVFGEISRTKCEVVGKKSVEGREKEARTHAHETYTYVKAAGRQESPYTSKRTLSLSALFLPVHPAGSRGVAMN